MNIDLVMKVVMAAAGVIGGVASTFINAKTLYTLAKPAEVANAEGTTDQSAEEV